MKKFNAKGVSSAAVAIGNASIYRHRAADVYRKKAENADAELKRLASARKKAVSELSELYKTALAELGAESAQIFEIQMMMAEAEDFNGLAESIIRSQSASAEYAVFLAADSFSRQGKY